MFPPFFLLHVAFALFVFRDAIERLPVVREIVDFVAGLVGAATRKRVSGENGTARTAAYFAVVLLCEFAVVRAVRDWDGGVCYSDG